MGSPPYTKDTLTAHGAQRRALEIVFGPITFQVARIMRKIGMLDLLAVPEHRAGKSLEEISRALCRPRYAVQILVESALSGGILYRCLGEAGEPERYCLTKAGFMLNRDAMTRVLTDFVHDVCYQGMFELERALETGEPEGLKRCGNWPSLYEALGSLPPPMRESWFRYDHYFSDCTFPEALRIVFDPAPRTLLDVGGNTGKWALRCVEYDPGVEVTVMDLSQQVRLMVETIADEPGAHRIQCLAMDFLDPAAAVPGGFDVIWMSQFLDCFRETDIVRILRLTAAAMTAETRLFINEVYWDRQRFETASFVLTQSSPYFTAIANGHSKFLYWPDMQRCIESAGLVVASNIDGLGWGHTLTLCRISGTGRGDNID